MPATNSPPIPASPFENPFPTSTTVTAPAIALATALQSPLTAMGADLRTAASHETVDDALRLDALHLDAANALVMMSGVSSPTVMTDMILPSLPVQPGVPDNASTIIVAAERVASDFEMVIDPSLMQPEQVADEPQVELSVEEELTEQPPLPPSPESSGEVSVGVEVALKREGSNRMDCVPVEQEGVRVHFTSLPFRDSNNSLCRCRRREHCCPLLLSRRTVEARTSVSRTKFHIYRLPPSSLTTFRRLGDQMGTWESWKVPYLVFYHHQVGDMRTVQPSRPLTQPPQLGRCRRVRLPRRLWRCQPVENLVLQYPIQSFTKERDKVRSHMIYLSRV